MFEMLNMGSIDSKKHEIEISVLNLGSTPSRKHDLANLYFQFKELEQLENYVQLEELQHLNFIRFLIQGIFTTKTIPIPTPASPPLWEPELGKQSDAPLCYSHFWLINKIMLFVNGMNQLENIFRPCAFIVLL